MARTTLLDIAKANGTDAVVGLIEENLKLTPELDIFPFRTIRGNTYSTWSRTGYTGGAFRMANEGQVGGKSTYKRSLVETFIFGGPMVVDRAVADAYEDGADAWLAHEASGFWLGSAQKLASQIWYGRAIDTKGFPGLRELLPLGTLSPNGEPSVINATGTTANTASSVYAIKFGDQAVTLVGGNNKAWEVGEWRDQIVSAPVEGGGTGDMDAYVAASSAWIGLQTVDRNSVRRIANITADVGKGLTDALLAQLLASFPANMLPDAIFMTRRSRSQLQASRTVVLQGQGTNRPDQPNIAPLPTQYDGVPIIVTDALLNTEAIEV